MNNKGVEPRVGMQVKFNLDEESKIIDSIENGVIYYKRRGKRDYSVGYVYHFMQGYHKIEWIPPTDEERMMFAKSCLHIRYSKGACTDFCAEPQHAWRHAGTDLMEVANIAESLALDGMDIDDVTKIEELMR